MKWNSSGDDFIYRNIFEYETFHFLELHPGVKVIKWNKNIEKDFKQEGWHW